MSPRLLDLFAGAGGAAMGYHAAGFEVVGVDIKAQPNYPFEFVQADALEVLRAAHRIGKRPASWAALERGFDAIHASPPCQAYSVTASLHDAQYPKLIEPVRELLKRIGLPYVIENVAGAPLENWTQLCGSSFGLGVRRHRLFETSFPVEWPPPCAHYLQPEPVDVTGTGGPATRERGQGGGIHRKPRNLAHAREVMGISWMSRRELAEAVPPAFTVFIGEALLTELSASASGLTEGMK